MKKIKLLQIIGDSTITGAPMVLLTLVKGLDKKKFDITCVCPPGPLAALLQEIKGISVFVVPMDSKWDFKAIKRLRNIIKTVDSNPNVPFIVHCHGLRGGFLGRLACIGPRDNAPKVVYTEHLWTSEYRLKNPISFWFQIFSLWFLDLVTDRTIAVSKAVADFLIKKGITRPEKVAVVYNGIETEVKSKKKKPKRKNSEITIGFVGSLVKRKGIEWLIRATSELRSEIKDKKLKIIVVGLGEEEGNLKNLAQRLKVDDIVDFRNVIENLDDIYPTLDIYVQPSLDEAFGIATLEAMSYGLPVVASNVGGLPELLNVSVKRHQGESDKLFKKPYQLTDCGILVPPGNSAALTVAILKILKNEKLAKKLGQTAEKRAKEFSAEKIVNETEKSYLSVIE